MYEFLIKGIRKIEAILNVSSTIWYHGAGAEHDSLIVGDGIDGIGVYLTKDLNRAKMYAKREK